MKGIVNFLIKLRSDATGAMQGARAVEKQLEKIDMQAQKVAGSLRKAFSPSAFGSALMSVPGMQFLTNPYTLMGAGIGAVTKLGAEAEMTASAFTTLVGSEERAKAILGEIKEFANDTPFDRMGLTKNAQTMMNFGVEADKVMGYLRQLGDVSGGNAERLSSLSLVMGQVTASGKLMGQDLIQFVNAGFNPLQELAQMTGKSYGELKDMMSDGAITAEHVAQALAHATGEGGRFHNLLGKMQGTVGQQIASLVGVIQDMAVDLFERLKPNILAVINIAKELLPTISNAIAVFASVVTGVIGFVSKFRQELVLLATIVGIVAFSLKSKALAIWVLNGAIQAVTWATNAWTFATKFLKLAIRANPIGMLITLISVLVAVVVYCWQKFAGFRAFIMTAWDTFKELGNIIKDYVIDRINSLLEGIGKVGKALKLLLSGNFSEAWSTFKSGVRDVVGVDAARKALGSTHEAVSSIGVGWQANLKREEAKDAPLAPSPLDPNKIDAPALKGSAPLDKIEFTTPGGKSKRGKDRTAQSIATGGARPTTINMTIGKLVERLEVHMMDKADTHELERVVLEAMNRSLAIATSTE